MRVHHEDQEASAEAVAAGLRAQGIPAVVERDDDLLGALGPTSRARFGIVVPRERSRQARGVLGEPLEPPEYGVGFYLTIAVLVGVLAVAVAYVVTRFV